MLSPFDARARGDRPAGRMPLRRAGASRASLSLVHRRDEGFKTISRRQIQLIRSCCQQLNVRPALIKRCGDRKRAELDSPGNRFKEVLIFEERLKQNAQRYVREYQSSTVEHRADCDCSGFRSSGASMRVSDPHSPNLLNPTLTLALHCSIPGCAVGVDNVPVLHSICTAINS